MHHPSRSPPPTLLADARLHAGDLDEASRVIDEALAIAEAGQGFFVPEVHRLRGDLALARGRRSAALVDYRAARSMACEQGARSLALRAATSEARLLVEAGDRSEARRVLDSLLIDWSEGFQTRDVLAACTLHHRLR